MKTILNKQLIRYLISGGTAFLSEYSVFFILFNFAGLGIVSSNIFSYICGIVISFSLNRSWSFKSDGFRYSSLKQSLFYLSLAVINLLITSFILSLSEKLEVEENIVKAMLMVMVAAWNFFIFKRFIFSRKA